MTRTLATQRQFVRNFLSCLSFNGSTSSVNVSLVNAVSGAGARSISAWFNPLSFTNKVIVSSGTTNQNSKMFEVYLSNSTTIAFAGWNDDTTFTVPKMNLGQWYHIVLTYDGTTLTVYLNGIAATPVVKSTLNTTGAGFTVGRRVNLVDNPFSGKIDKVLYYGRCLTATEALNLFNGINISLTSLLLDWEFDEGSGTSATDSSGNANTGTIANGTYSTSVYMVARSLAAARLLAATRLLA